MSDVVETRTNARIFGVPAKANSNNAQAQEQEVKDCNEFLKIEYAKFRQYKIIMEGIEELMQDDNNLDADLRMKIKKIVLSEQISQIQLSHSPNEIRPDAALGVPLSSPELTYSESNRLLSCLNSKLDNKCAKLKSECYSLFTDSSNTDKSESPLELAQNDIVLLDYRNKLVAEQEMYLKNQLELLELLEELKNIRLSTVPEVVDQKYHECKIRMHINDLKSQLAKNKYRTDVFMESRNSLSAYAKLLKDMKEQQAELRLDVQKLKDLKTKYSEVGCKEYDDILKSYLQYKASLKKRNLMLELCG